MIKHNDKEISSLHLNSLCRIKTFRCVGSLPREERSSSKIQNYVRRELQWSDYLWFKISKLNRLIISQRKYIASPSIGKWVICLMNYGHKLDINDINQKAFNWALVLSWQGGKTLRQI